MMNEHRTAATQSLNHSYSPDFLVMFTGEQQYLMKVHKPTESAGGLFVCFFNIFWFQFYVWMVHYGSAGNNKPACYFGVWGTGVRAPSASTCSAFLLWFVNAGLQVWLNHLLSCLHCCSVLHKLKKKSFQGCRLIRGKTPQRKWRKWLSISCKIMDSHLILAWGCRGKETPKN